MEEIKQQGNIYIKFNNLIYAKKNIEGISTRVF